jgi:hypothetical protein
MLFVKFVWFVVKNFFLSNSRYIGILIRTGTGEKITGSDNSISSIFPFSLT